MGLVSHHHGMISACMSLLLGQGVGKVSAQQTVYMQVFFVCTLL